jgi:hypothetical protein
MSVEQRAKLSLAQRAHVARVPRWPEHRRKLAAAEEVRRMTLFDNEVAAIVTLRRKGLNFSYIAEEIGAAARDRPQAVRAGSQLATPKPIAGPAAGRVSGGASTARSPGPPA